MVTSILDTLKWLIYTAWCWSFLDHYYARLRRIDEEILWPQIIAHAGGDTLRAAAAFQYHMYQDLPWLHIGVDRIDAELCRISGVRIESGWITFEFRE